MKFTIDEIKELMDKLASSGLGALTYKDGDFELKLEAKRPCPPSPMVSVPELTAAPAVPPQAQKASQETKEPEDAGNTVKAPIVGTFYRSSAPDKAPFVKVGSHVNKGDVICMIESMKLMNEVKSEFDGEVAKICAEDAQGVEYGQPLMLIK